jgi:hypothetical protein
MKSKETSPSNKASWATKAALGLMVVNAIGAGAQHHEVKTLEDRIAEVPSNSSEAAELQDELEDAEGLRDLTLSSMVGSGGFLLAGAARRRRAQADERLSDPAEHAQSTEHIELGDPADLHEHRS